MESGSSIAQGRSGVDPGRTRWSIVAAVREGSKEQARRSLGALCRRYWVPVYTYVRRTGRSPESASALVQTFLSDLVSELRADGKQITTGFREFLQERLEQFLSSPHASAGTEPLPEMGPPWPLEQIEKRQSKGRQAESNPAEALQRAFALEMLAITLERLRREAEESERGALFAAVRPFLSREPTPEDLATLAEQMHISPLAAVIAVKRLRQRFQELIDEELKVTVGDEHALETERHTLLTLVSPKSNE